MANSWIQHCKNYSKKHNKKYSDCLKDPNCKKAYKNGEGFGDVLKTVVNSDIGKSLINKGIDMATNKIKNKVNGRGLFSQIGSVLGTRGGPIGSIVGNTVGQMVDNKLGTGIKRGRKKKYGTALMP